MNYPQVAKIMEYLLHLPNLLKFFAKIIEFVSQDNITSIIKTFNIGSTYSTYIRIF